MALFIWKISQSINSDYDTYDSAVVIAATEDAARQMHPDGHSVFRQGRLGAPGWQSPDDDGHAMFPGSDWAPPANITVDRCGEADSGAVPGVIVASFNAS